MKKNTKRILWGAALIAVAVLIVLKAVGVNLGVLSGIPTIDIVLCALMLVVIVCAVIKKRYAAVVFPLALIYLLLEDEIIGWTGAVTIPESNHLIKHWIVLLAAVLLTVGIALITHKSKNGAPAAVRSRESAGSNQCVYIDAADFTEKSVSNDLGATNVFFSNVESYAGNGVLHVDNDLGAVIIHVPSEWQISVSIDNDLGSVSVPENVSPAGKLLRIDGSNDLGSVVVKFE